MALASWLSAKWAAATSSSAFMCGWKSIFREATTTRHLRPRDNKALRRFPFDCERLALPSVRAWRNHESSRLKDFRRDLILQTPSRRQKYCAPFLKTILVTGSSGLVGSEACGFFAAEGFKVHGVDNN